MRLTLTPEQSAVVDYILSWVRQGGHWMTFGGYAGTGKTTVIRELVELLPSSAVIAPTGKAAQVLRRKGVDARTAHSWLYGAPDDEDDHGNPVWGDAEPESRPDLVICDESSMVYRDLFNDMLGTGLRFLFVGDHGQLEPVGENPNLMKEPHVRLETIMRQASESPILSFAHHVRNGGYLTEQRHPGLTVAQRNGQARDTEWLASFDQIIVAFNRTRCAVNRFIRATTGRRGVLVPGDKVICLRNDRKKGLFNGLMGYVEAVRPMVGGADAVRFDFRSDEGRLFRDLLAPVDQFGAEKPLPYSGVPREMALFDYGYAITCHKSQGSEWDKVLVVEGWGDHWEMARWRYTAATRAARELTYLADRVTTREQMELFA